MRLAAEYLRPGAGADVAIIDGGSAHAELRIRVKGYEEPAAEEVQSVPRRAARPQIEDIEDDALATPCLISRDLFKTLRGTNNLVFPNSRREVERYTHLLAELSVERGVPNEFYPHHGSLSKEIREETERALKQNQLPATAICTNTLELGIDIGAVKSIAQVGTPPSVASLRQRLGRSGRRQGEPAILRGYCIEDALSQNATIETELRLGTTKMAAMISLLLEGWFEPPRTAGAHYSTLIQQALSAIAQYGGLTIGQMYTLLCAQGAPFATVTKEGLMALVRAMGEQDLVVQDSNGLLLHGRVGEKFVNHYTFYAAFPDEAEYRVVAGGKTLGTLPVDQMLVAGQRILFAGKTWLVELIDDQQKAIYVTASSANNPPLFKGDGGRTHTRVRQRMRELLGGTEPLAYLDRVAQRFLDEGRENYLRRDMATVVLRNAGDSTRLFTWLGDAANEAIACLLTYRGFQAFHGELGVEVRKASTQDIANALKEVTEHELPAPEELLRGVRNLSRAKWDWALPEDLLACGYASGYLDLVEAIDWLRHFGQR